MISNEEEDMGTRCENKVHYVRGLLYNVQCLVTSARVCVGVYLDIPAPWDSNIDYT